MTEPETESMTKSFKYILMCKSNDGSLECRTVASSLELDKSTMKKDAYTITVHLTPKSTWEITRQCV